MWELYPYNNDNNNIITSVIIPTTTITTIIIHNNKHNIRNTNFLTFCWYGIYLPGTPIPDSPPKGTFNGNNYNQQPTMMIINISNNYNMKIIILVIRKKIYAIFILILKFYFYFIANIYCKNKIALILFFFVRFKINSYTHNCSTLV